MANVLIAAGGTGGHVYPAIALAETLRDRGHAVAFAGGDRVEARLVPEAGFALHRLPGRSLPRRPTPGAVVSGVVLGSALVRARRLVRELVPDVVVGMGGYPSLAPAWAAAASRRPVVLHEQNARLSLAHRLSVRWASMLALSLELEEGAPRSARRVSVVGNPLRATIRELAMASEPDRARRRTQARDRFGCGHEDIVVLVFGGSLGARTLNAAALRVLGTPGPAPVHVLHIAGSRDEVEVRRLWEGAAVRHSVFGYVDSMQDAYAAADLVLCRAGATTVAELAAVGLPAVLVPLPIAPADAQGANARAMERAGAGIAVRERDGDLAAAIRGPVRSLVEDAALRVRMSTAAKGMGRPDAAERLADLVVAAAGGA